MNAMRVVLATDCGSTTTKAILFEQRPEGWRQTFRGEAPTTVEAPFSDVTRGVLNAIAEVEELSGRTILDGERLLTPAGEQRGIDAYLSTSSAGGGLQMLVAGAVKEMTAESAQRAALGAGAIVMDVLAINDGRLPHQRIERIRNLRPDMILLSGGTDGGTTTHVVELAEWIAAARPQARLGQGYALPVVYAGNQQAIPDVERTLGALTALHVTENLRPTLERENLGPARQCIQDLFMEHVMAQAPGYDRLREWTALPIVPTPAAVGDLVQIIAQRRQANVLCVDIGGATTDVFSVFDGVFNRTVSANLGMSYSVSNVLAEAGSEAVLRWLPFELRREEVQNRTKNKMIRPTTIPQTIEDLILEQALCREALRLALEQHRSLAVGLSGVQHQRSMGDVFAQTGGGRSLVDLGAVDLIIGSGGVLSHAPRRAQAMLALIDAFAPEWFTRLAVDSIFMMPHLGVFSRAEPDAALSIFERDCLVPLGTCVAPTGRGSEGKPCLEYELILPDGRQRGTVAFGELVVVPLSPGDKAQLHARPARGFDVGAGPGKPRITPVSGGHVGLVLDGRGRPLVLADKPSERQVQLARWAAAIGAFTD